MTVELENLGFSTMVSGTTDAARSAKIVGVFALVAVGAAVFLRRPPILEATLEETSGDDWGWDVVFMAGRPHREFSSFDGRLDLEFVPGYQGSRESFDRDDIAEILASVDGGTRDKDLETRRWLALVRLKDGRYATFVASKGYSGWFQGGSTATLADNLADAIMFGFDDEARRKLRLPDLEREEDAPATERERS